MKRMIILAVFSAVLCALPRVTVAQTVISVDITKARLLWTWTQGTGGAATEFLVKCGAATGIYTAVTRLADPAARSVAVSAVVSGLGPYFCVVSAANQFGQSPNSNEVAFAAGVAPLAPTNLLIEVQ